MAAKKKVVKRKAPPRPRTQGPRAVVLEDSFIASMSKDPKISAKFPALQQVARQLANKRGCGKCGHKNRARARAFQAAKSQIASLPPERQQELKELLGVDEMTFYVRDPETKKLIQRTV